MQGKSEIALNCNVSDVTFCFIHSVPSDEMTSSELVALGKRNMACHDVNNAVLCYARACSKM